MSEFEQAGSSGDSLDSRSASLFRRWLPIVAIVAGAFVGTELRSLATDIGPVTAESEPDAASSDVWSALKHVPQDAYFVAGIRPRALLQTTKLPSIDRSLAALFEYGLGRRVDILPSDVEQFVVVGTYGGARLADYNAMAIVRLTSRIAADHFMESQFGSEFDGESLDETARSAVVTVRQLSGALLDERTVLLGQPAVLQNWSFSSSPQNEQPAEFSWPVRSKAAAATHAFVVLDIERLRRFAPRYDDWMLSEHPWLAAASPLLRTARRLEIVASGGAGLKLETTVSSTQEALSDVADTLRAGTTILRNVLSELPPGLAPWSREVAVPTLILTRDILRQPDVESDPETASVRLTMTADRDQLDAFRRIVEPLAGTLEVSARRALRSQNLQRIAIAVLDYYEAHNHLPLPAPADRDSRIPHSWRVTLLPFLGEQALFDRYRQNEPWNSQANQEVLRLMPDVYRHVDDAPTSYRSAYYALVGPETAFGDGREPVRLRDIRDGSSNTILVVESRQGVPWTMPSDIEVLPDRPLPSFGGFDPTGAFVARADTSVSFLPNSTPEVDRRAFITRAGGERITLP
ncbi:DUF1559 domain-containing protein [bacterium]|nr:DUF1559 domain-containing protein [bacterium]